MWGRETISSFRNAADVVNATAAEVHALAGETRHDLPAVVDAITLLSARVSETLPTGEEAVALTDDLKTAAQAVSIAAVLISTVAVAALVLASVAVMRTAYPRV